MRIRFWGVRGSSPTPLTPALMEARITEIVRRIQPKDLVNEHSRKVFIDSLPKWLSSIIGGNTSCVELETASGDTIVLDAGSGIREFGIDASTRENRPSVFHLFLTHFHWDHLSGIPFFNPAYNPRNEVIFYATRKNFKNFLTEQMKYPYFPIPMIGERGFSAHLDFRYLAPSQTDVVIGSTRVTWHRVRHPGGCTAYSFEENGKRFIFSTDTEVRPQDFKKTPENTAFYMNAHMLIIDAQYTMSDSIKKEGWGHTTFAVAIDFAAQWNIKQLVLFHHEPTYTDEKIYTQIKAHAEYYCKYNGYTDLEIIVACEGMELVL